MLSRQPITQLLAMLSLACHVKNLLEFKKCILDVSRNCWQLRRHSWSGNWSLKLGPAETACAVNYLFLRRTTPHAHVGGVMFQTVFVSSQARRKQFDTGLANLFPSSAPSPSLTTGWPQFFWGGGQGEEILSTFNYLFHAYSSNVLLC